MNKEIPVVGILMGSDSDYDIMVEAAKVLKQFDIPFEMIVSSAHRTPERTMEYVRGARDKGIKVLIAGAGAAAHLAGVVAAETMLPVIAVPIDATSMRGLDALLAMVQMPAGIRWRQWPLVWPDHGMPAFLQPGCWQQKILNWRRSCFNSRRIWPPV